MHTNKVVIYRSKQSAYPEIAPFHPSSYYPEYEYEQISEEPNTVYNAVRETLYLAGLDANNIDTKDWNPLGEYIRPGDVVLLKPNLVKEYHPSDPDGWRYIITHGSIIRAVCDYAFKALKGNGKIIVADAPQTDSSFNKIVEIIKLEDIQKFYRTKGLDFEIIDFRKQQWCNTENVIVDRLDLNGDPNGYIAYDLKDNSEFCGHTGQGHYYGADYDTGELNRHHNGGKHEYLIAGSAIKCNVFINLPKLKTHKKAGVTVNLKNLVGVNGDKNWLPHYTLGHPKNGGDQYAEYNFIKTFECQITEFFRNLSLRFPTFGTWLFQKVRKQGVKLFGGTENIIRSGNWYGNDTVWRMCLDLNKIVLYANQDGSFRCDTPTNKKRYLSFVDGIIAGQGDGPMNPDPLPAGIVLFGDNPANVDAAASVLMGFDPDKIPIIRQSFMMKGFPISEINWREIICTSNEKRWDMSLASIFESGDTYHFKPHFGWKGYIERNARN